MVDFQGFSIALFDYRRDITTFDPCWLQIDSLGALDIVVRSFWVLFLPTKMESYCILTQFSRDQLAKTPTSQSLNMSKPQFPRYQLVSRKATKHCTGGATEMGRWSGLGWKNSHCMDFQICSIFLMENRSFYRHTYLHIYIICIIDDTPINSAISTVAWRRVETSWT